MQGRQLILHVCAYTFTHTYTHKDTYVCVHKKSQLPTSLRHIPRRVTNSGNFSARTIRKWRSKTPVIFSNKCCAIRSWCQERHSASLPSHIFVYLIVYMPILPTKKWNAEWAETCSDHFNIHFLKLEDTATDCATHATS